MSALPNPLRSSDDFDFKVPDQFVVEQAGRALMFSSAQNTLIIDGIWFDFFFIYKMKKKLVLVSTNW